MSFIMESENCATPFLVDGAKYLVVLNFYYQSVRNLWAILLLLLKLLRLKVGADGNVYPD